MNEFLQDMILTELEDAVGRENCSMREIDRMTHGVTIFGCPGCGQTAAYACRKRTLLYRRRMQRKPLRC